MTTKFRLFAPTLLGIASFASMATAPAALAQAVSTNGGSIQGTISDSSGAAIPNATVVISSPATGYTHTLQTDNSGFYSLGPLIPGNYTIQVSAPNFQKLRVQTVIRVGTVTPGSEKLTIGNQDETVEVNAGQLQVNTDQIGVSGVITREQIDALPVNGRNILDIAQIQPGVILQQGQSFDPTKAGYSAISTSGVSGRTTRILLDGQDITDETVGTTIFNVPSGPVEELQLNRSTQDVSGEVTSTGQVLVTTRSGTNAFHGNLFYNFQDNNAGFALINGANLPFQRNQFGGYAGGPLIKDKLFFFGGAERVKQDQLDPAQGSPTFANIFAQFPSVPAPFRDTYSTARLDYHGAHGINYFVRGTYSVNADVANFGLSPYSLYSNRDNVPAIVGGADLAYGRFTHSVRFGYEKFHNILGDATAQFGTSIYNPSTSAANQVALVGGGGGFNAGPNYLAPQGTYQSDKQFRYDGTLTLGAHGIKFGFNMNRILNGGFAEFYGASLYTAFSDSPGQLAANCGGVTGAAPCPDDPYNGYIAQYYVIGNGNSLFSERPGFGLSGGGNPSWRFGAYLADTWKATPAITLTAGLRWSVDTDRANQDVATPLCSSLDPSLQFAGCTGNTPLFDQYQAGFGAKTHQPYANFGPQFGFVVSPGDHKTSIRGGIGVYYDSDIFNNTGNSRTAVIQANGAYFNYGLISAGQSRVNLPGYGSVTSVNGVPLSAITSEPISVAAPQLNALKAQYQAKVQGTNSANPSFIGTGGGLFANSIYAAPYVTPYSVQVNGGVQREFGRGIVFSADYIHNSIIKLPLSQDVNHDGAARTLNITAARNAVVATMSNFPSCPQDATAAAINCAIANGASITSFASNGLDSGASYLGGYSASANGLTPDTGAAFAGTNPNVGEGLFILPIGRSGYDALQLVLQEQASHPLPGILTSNLQISYSFSRVVSSNNGGGSAGGGAADQNFAGSRPFNNDNPNLYMGRNNLDHTNELSLGGSFAIKYGIQTGFVGHFFSAPPTSLTLDNSAGATGQIFLTDVDGDGTSGDLVPGTEPGYYMHQVKGAGLNGLINSYNSTHAGQPTPAGQALINAGIFTKDQLTALGGVQQAIATAPNSPLNNPMFRSFDLNASYPIRLSRFREGLSLVPGVAMYNVFNMSNFNGFGGLLLNAADAGQNQYLNGPNNQLVLNSNRIQRGAGTFDQGGPRSTEFQLKLNF